MGAGGSSEAASKPAVGVITICALFLMYSCNLSRKPRGQSENDQLELMASAPENFANALPGSVEHTSIIFKNRHLLQEELDDVEFDTNCTAPKDHHVGYNNSCDFILDQCGDELQLFNYLKLVLCDFSRAEVCIVLCW